MRRYGESDRPQSAYDDDELSSHGENVILDDSDDEVAFTEHHTHHTRVSEAIKLKQLELEFERKNGADETE